jgi:hypothetical protein
MKLVNRTSSAHSEQSEQQLEAEIRELAPKDGSHTSQIDNNVQLATNNLDALMRRISLTSTREIDRLISELKVLRDKINTDGDRIERQLADYAEFNQSVIQLTNIISDGLTHLKKVSVLPKAVGLPVSQKAESVAD